MIKKYILIGILVIVLGVLWFKFDHKNDLKDVTNKSENAPANSYSTSTSSNVPETQSTSTASIASSSKSNSNVNSNNKKHMTAIMHTNKGDIEIELNGKGRPVTVENFEKLAESGFYDKVKFHRVIKGFMIQGGDPNSKDDTKPQTWGMGGPGYKFNDEIVGENKNNIGTISMANAGPNTNGSQFFINTGNNNFLDDKHTVFGKVVKGMDVVSAIENVQTNNPQVNRPISPIIINSITLK